MSIHSTIVRRWRSPRCEASIFPSRCLGHMMQRYFVTMYGADVVLLSWQYRTEHRVVCIHSVVDVRPSWSVMFFSADVRGTPLHVGS